MKEEIVKKLLSKGKLLTPDLLATITDEQISGMVGGDLVLDRPDFAHRESAAKKDEIKIIKNLTAPKTTLTPDDFANFYRAKYEKIREILTSRIRKPFVSINKVGAYLDESYVIGIVRDIRDNGDKTTVDIEDNTGAASIIFEGKPDIGTDDVVAIRAISSKNILFGKQVIQPDIPLRQPTVGWGKVCLVSNLMIDEAPIGEIEKFFLWFENEDIKYLVVAGDVGDIGTFERMVDRYCREKEVVFIPGERDTRGAYPRLPVQFSTGKILSLSDPAFLEINGVKILVIHEFELSMLKKRYLGHGKAVSEENYFVLEDTPDIVCFGHASGSQVTNYKSVTIATSGSMLADFRPVVIDLETRDAKQVQIFGK